MKKYFITSILIILIFLPSFVSAHLEAGEDKVVGKYLIDFGYTPDEVEAGKPVTLVFNLQDNKTQALIVPDNEWIRIAEGDAVYFAGYFAPQAGNVGFVYTFPSAGTYDITAKFYKAKKELVENSVTIVVVSGVNSSTLLAVSDEPGTHTNIFYIAAGVALFGVALALFLKN